MLGIGSDQGVAVNDAVVAAIVRRRRTGRARVKEVTGGTATVQTLLDPTTGVTAQVQGASGAVGTIVPASGTPGELTMVQVPKSVRVRKGDTVITTGSSGRLTSLYPDGIPIGRVSQVTIADSALTMEIQVTPFVDFSNPRRSRSSWRRIDAARGRRRLREGARVRVRAHGLAGGGDAAVLPARRRRPT